MTSGKKLFTVTAVAVCLVIALAVTLSACATSATPPMVNETYMADADTLPSFDGVYAAQMQEAMNSTSLDVRTKAAYAWSIASYEIDQASQVVYFQNKLGNTTMDGKSGKLAYQQYHKEKRADGAYKGEKYHYTIKHVYDSSIDKMYADFLESARMRFVANNDELGFTGLYRFELDGKGEEVTVFTGKELFGQELLSTNWKKGSDFGKEESIMKAGLVAPATASLSEVIAAIDNDIRTCEIDDRRIEGNINLLVDGIISEANMTVSEDGNYYTFEVTVNVDVANADERSIEFLKSDNTASEISWNRMKITFQVWKNGLMKCYNIDEEWTGTVSPVSLINIDGSASAVNNIFYSYSDADCSFEKEHEFLSDFIKNNG